MNAIGMDREMITMVYKLKIFIYIYNNNHNNNNKYHYTDVESFQKFK